MGSDIDKLTISCPIHTLNIKAIGRPTDVKSTTKLSPLVVRCWLSVDGCPLMEIVPADAGCFRDQCTIIETCKTDNNYTITGNVLYKPWSTNGLYYLSNEEIYITTNAQCIGYPFHDRSLSDCISSLKDIYENHWTHLAKMRKKNNKKRIQSMTTDEKCRHPLDVR